MSDDALLWSHKPVRTEQPHPSEPLWSFRKAHVTWSCELRFHGESYGWEAQILRDGEMVIGRRFVLKEQAVKWAEDERKTMISS